MYPKWPIICRAVCKTSATHQVLPGLTPDKVGGLSLTHRQS